MDPVLPVENVPFDETVEITGDISNMTVEQYMSWVRTQAKRLPNVFRATIDPTPEPRPQYMPVIEDIHKCPEKYLPSEEWERETVYQFSELRMKIYNLSLNESLKERKVSVPPMKDRKNWVRFTLGEIHEVNKCAEEPKVIEESDEMMIKRRKLEIAANLGITLAPTNKILENMQEEGEINEPMEEVKEPAKLTSENDHEEKDDGDEEEYDDEDSVLSMEIDNLDDQQKTSWEGEINHLPTIPLLMQFDQVLTQRLLEHLIEYFEEEKIMSERLFQWIYCLLARVEKPIHRDVVASIRQLYRTCCNIRANLQEDSSDFEKNLAGLNLLITLTGYYFGQSEDCGKFVLPNEDDHALNKKKDNQDGKEIFSANDFAGDVDDDEEEEDDDEEEKSDEEDLVDDDN